LGGLLALAGVAVITLRFKQPKPQETPTS
jgi:hypothetical protein